MARRTLARGADYRLLITPRYDDRRRVWTTLFLLQTTKAFATFRYELSASLAVEAKTITITVLGLSAPGLSLPAAGHAEFTQAVDGLRGTYEISVAGLDGRTGRLTARIGESAVRILTPPDPAVLIATTDPDSARPL